MFKLYTSKYRAFSEPCRLACTWLKLEVEEGSTDYPLMKIDTSENNKSIEGKEIYKFLHTLWLESEMCNIVTDEEKLISFDILNKVGQKYIQACEITSKVLMKNDAIELNFEFELLKKQDFLLGASLSICDVMLYEIISIYLRLRLIHYEEIIYKFIERFKIHPAVSKHFSSLSHYHRPYSPYLDSDFNQKEAITKKNCRFICNQVTLFEKFFKKGVRQSEVLLFPKKVLKNDLEVLKKTNIVWAKLFDRMARNVEWFSEVGQDLYESDPFAARMLDIAIKAHNSPFTSKIHGCSFRNDVMYSSKHSKYLQIEYNLIAVGGIADSMHSAKFQNSIGKNFFPNDTIKVENIDNVQNHAQIYGKAHQLYNNREAVCLIIIDPHLAVMNSISMRQLILLEEYNLMSYCFTLEDLISKLTFDDKEGGLYLEGNEVSVVDFAGGDDPRCYENEKCWKIREIIEISRAIKIPPIGFGIIDFKPFQSYLSKEGTLEKFLEDKSEIELIRNQFVKFWELSNEEQIDEVLALVKENPNNYVLKSPREGGAVHYFDEEIERFILRQAKKDLKKYILMERIKMAGEMNFIAHTDDYIESSLMTDELGLFTYFLSDESGIIEIHEGSVLVRSKRASGQTMAGLNSIISNIQIV